MQKLKQNKGITLIALIITIIVMLILVGVTINVALNGGLFQKAETAKEGTQKALEEEQLMVAIVSAYDEKTGVVDKTTLQTELSKQGAWQVSGEGPYGVTSPKGNEYTVTKTGKIAQGWVDNGDGSYTKGDTTVKVGETTYTTPQVLEKLGIAPSQGKYNGNWVVIGVEGDKIKLVSEGNVGSDVTLGKTDPNAYEKDAQGNPTTTIKSEIKDYNSDDTIGEFDIAVWSYAHAVETLNNAAKTATGIESARSIKIEDIYDIIGEENVTKGTNHGKMFKYYFNGTTVYSQNKATASDEYDETSAYNTNKDTQVFVKYPDNIEENPVGQIIQIHSGDTDASVELTYNSFEYTLTPEQKAKIGSLTEGSPFHLASFCASPGYGNVRFWSFWMASGIIWTYDFFDSDGYSNNVPAGVRAVIEI